MRIFKFKTYLIFLSFIPVLMAGSCNESDDPTYTPPPSSTEADVDVAVYLTTSDQNSLLALQEDDFVSAVSDEELTTLSIDSTQQYQDIDGFGFSLTGGSAKLISALSATKRANLLTELFDTTDSYIGVSYLRISIGSSDLDEYTFSYNSTEDDVDMENFDLGYDRNYLIPVLQEILAINPNIKILGSPWSAPVWMKTNGSTIGGSLSENYYNAYANYFVSYIEAMAAEGIPIDAITVQNEPLNPDNNPSMYMEAEDQAAFIKNNLGPAFAEAGITTKIISYDHNADVPEYPITVLDDAEAYAYVNGSAFHLYAGDISALTTVHAAYPDKAIYFTEQWIGAPSSFADDFRWHVREVVIGATRNWSRNALEWNLAADENQDPHTDGGCDECLGALTINGQSISRNTAYYIIGQASKFIRPGAVRIASDESSSLPNVAFLTPDHKIVVLVLNDSGSSQTFNISLGDDAFTSTLADGAAATFIITP